MTSGSHSRGADAEFDEWPADCQPQHALVFAHNELVLPISIEQAWQRLIAAEQWPLWYSNASRVRVDAPDGLLAAGVRFKWVTFGVPVLTTVTLFDPPSRLAWRGRGLGSRGYHVWMLRSLATGCRVVTEEVQVGFPVRVLAPLMVRGLLRQHQRWLAGIAPPDHRTEPGARC